MSAFEIGRAVGAAIGMTIGVVLVLVIFMISNKNRKMKTEYDERQQIIRGKGYKYAFFGVTIYAVLCFFLGMMGLELPMEPAVEAFSYIFVGVVVNIVYCIIHDAYWGLNNNRKRYLIIMGAIVVLNTAVVIRTGMDGELVVYGMLSSVGINLLVTVMMLILFVTLGIHSIREKREV